MVKPFITPEVLRRSLAELSGESVEWPGDEAFAKAGHILPKNWVEQLALAGWGQGRMGLDP